MAELRLHNTLTGVKEVFTPRDPERVTMYVCGPTVYNYVHIGNARPVVVFDCLFRLLTSLYPQVVYARNITDIDDKIIDAASVRGTSITEISAEFTEKYREDMAQLNALPPSIEPMATEHIEDMIALIERLIGEGHAYQAEGHALFAVESMPGYGALSGRNLEDMMGGARVEVADYKRHPGDFVLWKPSEDHDPGWDSPWGRGRPGWHIECSAMAHDLLGAEFDIHGGGNDLQFPHHENEIAQSCCAGHGFAKVWLHNEMLQVEGKKMSKSLGNFFTVKDLLDQGVSGEVIRFVMLSTHYRKPMDWTEKKRADAEKTLAKWRGLAADGGQVSAAVIEALGDDLNTAGAIAELHRLASAGEGAALKASAQFLGLLEVDEAGDEVDLSALEARLLELRTQAMETKDFGAVDALKTKLLAAGIQVQMSKAGVSLSAPVGFDAATLEELL